MADDQPDAPQELDAREFLRNLLALSAEDAKAVRDATPTSEERQDDAPPLPANMHERRNHRHYGPSGDYGDEKGG